MFKVCFYKNNVMLPRYFVRSAPRCSIVSRFIQGRCSSGPQRKYSCCLIGLKSIRSGKVIDANKIDSLTMSVGVFTALFTIP